MAAVLLRRAGHTVTSHDAMLGVTKRNFKSYR